MHWLDTGAVMVYIRAKVNYSQVKKKLTLLTGSFKVYAMKITLWVLSFLFLIIGTITGIGASIGALDMEWYAVAVFSIGMMFSSASWADSIGE